MDMRTTLAQHASNPRQTQLGALTRATAWSAFGLMLRESEGRGSNVRLFPPFRLDVRDERLWKGTSELKLRRKPFAILRYLTANPQRLVTQEELVEAVWGKIAMSESLLRTHVSELRHVLGDDMIETVVGRGYRFLPDVQTEKPTANLPKQAELPTPSLVGRSAEIEALWQVFEAALEQKRQMVFIAGDPGIGKTALTDAFLTRITATNGVLVASGSCVEQFGTGEAYLPVLAALGAVCRGPNGEGVVEVLAQHAPTWLEQMPGLVPDEKLPALRLRVQGATQARMLRELAEAFEVLAAEMPLVLVLEDLQWSDRSTLDLIATLGARREPARIVIAATCRPTELTKGEGLAKIIAELTAHKQAIALNLGTWSEVGVAEYLGRRFSGAAFPDDLASTIHRMTGGNPMFTISLVDDLESRQMVRQVGGKWELAVSVGEVAKRRPDTVRQLIDIQMDRLKSNEQRILEAASLVGAQFAAGSVAHALELPADEVDSICEGLVNEHRFLRFVSAEEWPDGTIQSQYAFLHALYRDAALARVPSAGKRLWHRRVADGLEAAYGNRVEAVAPELAIHFDEAQLTGKAVRYYCMAGERAMRRFGRADALAYFNRARVLLAKLPASDESDRTELMALKHVGPAIIALQGVQDPALERVLVRTAELARKLGDDRSLLGALLGMQRRHILQGELRQIEQYEGEVNAILGRLPDPVAAAEATVVSTSARLFRGQLASVREPLRNACNVLDAAANDKERVINAPVVGLWGGHMVVLAWLSGAADEAVVLAGKMRAGAESLQDPFLLSTALTIAALAHMWRREPEKTLELAKHAVQAAREVGSPVWHGRAMSLQHWAATMLAPQAAEGHFGELSSALSGQLKAGPYGRTAFTPCVIEVFARAGHADRAMKELDEALAFVEATDERAWSSELHRLRGELLKEGDPAEAEQATRKALEIARQQGAKSYELRAALSLAKLARGAKKRAALEDLRRTYASFSEGLDTGDLVEAKALLGPSR
jgi:DNA-binding winged helix-turn-helix (wHTH) protein/tetratricopeptide (TPR) repeat protein